MPDHRWFLAVAPFQGENARLHEVHLDVLEDVLKGGVATRVVVLVVVTVAQVRVGSAQGQLPQCGDRNGAILVDMSRKRLMARGVSGDAIPPDRHPDFDMTHVRGQMGMLAEPRAAFSQPVDGTLDLDCSQAQQTAESVEIGITQKTEKMRK